MRTVLLTMIGAIAVAAAGIDAQTQPSATAQPGRYALIHTEGGSAVVFDTATGQVSSTKISGVLPPPGRFLPMECPRVQKGKQPFICVLDSVTGRGMALTDGDWQKTVAAGQ